MKKIFILFIITFLCSCSSKRAFYAPFQEEPKKLIAEVNKKTDGIEKYMEYKTRLKELKKEWNLYENLRESLAKEDYKMLELNYAQLETLHNSHKDIVKFEEYMNGGLFYFALSLAHQYKFTEAVKKFELIPAASVFYKKGLDCINKLSVDSDEDSYIDAWEIIEGYNPMNPYSHP